jgi:tetratricopeptide (TPR) repeat protein
VTFYALAVLVVLAQSNTASTQPRSFAAVMSEGRVEYDKGHLDNAERLFSEALALVPKSAESNRARILSDLAAVYGGQEKFSQAEQDYWESLSISKRLGNTDDCALMLQNIAMLYSRQNKDEEAARLLSQAQQLVKSNPKADVRVKVEILNGMGIVLYRRDNNGKAAAYFNQALQAISSAGIKFDTAGILNNLGAVYIAEHKYREAEETLHQALAAKEAEFGVSHPKLVPTLSLLALSYTDTRRFSEAEDQYRRVLKILEPQGSTFATGIARALHGLSITYFKANRMAEAATALAEAAPIAQLNIEREPEMAAIVEDYSNLLKTQGKVKEAAALHAEAIRARTVTGLVVRANSLVQ